MWASVVVAHGVVAPWLVGSSQTRDWTPVPCIGRWLLNHWTTSEVPIVDLHILWIPESYHIFELQIFCLGLWLILTFSEQCLPKSKNSWFWWSPVYCFFPFMGHAFGVYYILNAQENLKKSLGVSFHITLDKSTKNLALFFSQIAPLSRYIDSFVCLYLPQFHSIIDKTSQFYLSK